MSDSHGFALMEVLVAAALFALVMLLAVQGARLALGGWNSVERLGDVQAEILTAQHVLRRLMTEAEPVLVLGADGRLAIAFEGEARSLSLMAAVPVAEGRLSAVSVIIDSSKLVAVTAPVEPSAHRQSAPLEDGAPTLLLDGILSGGFAYWGSDPPESEPRWHERWSGSQALPQAIRLRLTLDRGRHWPDVIAAPRMEAPVDF